MGTFINLLLDDIEIDSSKNHIGTHHGRLFQKADFQPDTSINYETSVSDCLMKPVELVSDRLKLLGYSEGSIKAELTQIHQHVSDEETIVWGVDAGFEELVQPEVNRLLEHLVAPLDLQDFINTEKYDLNHLSEITNYLRPYSYLYMLCKSPKMKGHFVKWEYAEIVNNGWVKIEEINTEIPISDQFLIVTEGTSDAKILEHAFEILYPHISDFFYFVDTSTGYSFSSAGGMFNFIKALSSIKSLNNVIALFDHDAEGFRQYQKSKQVDLPDNIKLMMLPHMDEFVKFSTLGPSGITQSDINGSAVSIECFLDFVWKNESTPMARWTSFSEKLDRYQGEIIDKESYTRRFLDLKGTESSYDFSKIKVLLDTLIDAASTMKSNLRIEQLKKQVWS